MDPSGKRRSDTSLFAGIDGGQSSTTAVVVNGAGDVLGRGTAGPCDHVDEPPDSRRCAEACEAAVARALAAARLPAQSPLEAVVVGLSGYDGTFHGVPPRFDGARVRFVHDAPIALAGAVDRRPAVVVIAGTGSVAYAEDAARQPACASAVTATFSVTKAAASRWLAERLRTRWIKPIAAATAGWARRRWRTSIAPICAPSRVRSISRRSHGPSWQRFARVVLDAARLGDAEAVALVERAANALATLAANAIERLGLGAATVTIAFTGGLFTNADFYRRTVEQLNGLAANARIVKPLHDPATGAARMALDGA